MHRISRYNSLDSQVVVFTTLNCLIIGQNAQNGEQFWSFDIQFAITGASRIYKGLDLRPITLE